MVWGLGFRVQQVLGSLREGSSKGVCSLILPTIPKPLVPKAPWTPLPQGPYKQGIRDGRHLIRSLPTKELVRLGLGAEKLFELTFCVWYIGFRGPPEP